MVCLQPQVLLRFVFGKSCPVLTAAAGADLDMQHVRSLVFRFPIT